jgi:hypothetical protein
MIYEGHSAIASYHIFGVIFQHQCCLIVFLFGEFVSKFSLRSISGLTIV